MSTTRRSVLLSASVQRSVAFCGALVAVYWLWSYARTPARVYHRHDPGAHGGVIVPVGGDHYHVEALFAEGGVVRLYMLGRDESRVVTVPRQTITAYLRTAESAESKSIALEATPQPDDPPGETSVFEGRMPLEFVGARLVVVVPSITIGKNRYRFNFATLDAHEPQMPAKVTDDAERELYLTPGGKLTTADIKANGSVTASEKYRGFMSAHDMHPAAGAAVCPITRTKANPKCTWIIGGKTYSFCCPPCIDEFVKLAKQHPEQIQDPRDYVQK